jgi:hypothetical protein
MKRPCVACGLSGAVQAHHVTGRPAPGRPHLDPDFVVDLCKRCHDREHVALRRVELEFPTGPASRHRLLRTANLMCRLIEAGRLPNWLMPVVGLLCAAATEVPAEPEGAHS